MAIPQYPKGTSLATWRTWWEASSNFSTNKSSPSFHSTGASRLLERCIRNCGWTHEFSQRVLKGYKDFMYASSVVIETESVNWLVPSIPIHKMWMQHILDTQNYVQDCQLLLGTFLHYNQYESPSEKDLALLEKRQIETKKFIAEITLQKEIVLDKFVWKYAVISNTSSREQVIFATPNLKSCLSHNEGVRSGHNSVTTSLLKRRSSEDNQSCLDDKENLVARPTKRTRTHPWDSKKDSTITIHIISKFKQPYLASREKENKDHFEKPIAKHVTLNRIFQEYAKQVNMKRKCLNFCFNGKILHGTETPHALRKWMTFDVDVDKIEIDCEPVLLEC